ncbi:MAG: thymidine kinase [Candidatus Nanopelagicales bacterium]
MAELVFFSGTMDSGKSTLALQTHHNHSSAGRKGLVFSKNDRLGNNQISSRLGLTANALEVSLETDFHKMVTQKLSQGEVVDYLICDEAQFYTPEQVEQLARLVDDLEIDVFTFGITTDFRTDLFPGAKRLLELADRVNVLQVETLCWCGRKATHQARIVNGVMTVEGEQVVVGDAGPTAKPDTVVYEVVCRKHHMRQVTSRVAKSEHISKSTLPFN